MLFHRIRSGCLHIKFFLLPFSFKKKEVATHKVLFAYFFSYFLFKKKVGKENFRWSLRVGILGCHSKRLFYLFPWTYFLFKKKVSKENFRRSLRVGFLCWSSLRLFHTLESQPNALGNHNFIPSKHVSDGYARSSFCLLFLLLSFKKESRQRKFQEVSEGRFPLLVVSAAFPHFRITTQCSWKSQLYSLKTRR